MLVCSGSATTSKSNQVPSGPAKPSPLLRLISLPMPGVCRCTLHMDNRHHLRVEVCCVTPVPGLWRWESSLKVTSSQAHVFPVPAPSCSRSPSILSLTPLPTTSLFDYKSAISLPPPIAGLGAPRRIPCTVVLTEARTSLYPSYRAREKPWTKSPSRLKHIPRRSMAHGWS